MIIYGTNAFLFIMNSGIKPMSDTNIVLFKNGNNVKFVSSIYRKSSSCKIN